MGWWWWWFGLLSQEGSSVGGEGGLKRLVGMGNFTGYRTGAACRTIVPTLHSAGQSPTLLFLQLTDIKVRAREYRSRVHIEYT